MRVRRAIAKATLKLSGWKLRTEPVPPDNVGLLIGAPHTSNWDFIMMLSITWSMGMSVKYLGKDSLFKAPFGGLMRALGGIPVDRKNPVGVVEDVVDRASTGEKFFLVITPEGTRAKGKFWKSGFYRIATEGNLPITLAYVDGPSKTCGLGPTFRPTGDVRADMDLVREFYADKTGIRAGLFTEPRLREERRGSGSADQANTAQA